MNPTALGLVLMAAVCHTSWNLLLKRAPRPLETQAGAVAWAVLLASPVLFVYSARELSPTAWALVAASGLFETGYVFALTAAYAAGDLSVVYPIARGSAALFVVPIAIAVLGERPSPSGLLGIALVLAGVFSSDPAAFRRGARSPGRRRAVALALTTGSMTAGYSLVNKVGVGLVAVPLYAYLVFVVNVAAVHAIMWARGGPRPTIVGAGGVRAALIGLLMITAFVAVLSAMALAPVSYVVAAREVGVVVAALLGRLVLNEPHSRSRGIAALIIFAGLVVIALSR